MYRLFRFSAAVLLLTFVVILILLPTKVKAQPTFHQNVECAETAIQATPTTEFYGLYHKMMMLQILGAAKMYAPGYPSLAAMLLDTNIRRTDGCVNSGTPDTYMSGGPYGMDFIISCPAQSIPYACMSAARAQLP